MNGTGQAKRSFRIDDLLRKDENDYVIPERHRNEGFSRRSNFVTPMMRPGASSAVTASLFPRREIEIRRREIELPRREIELPRREIELPRREIELQRREIELPRREIELPRREIELPRQEIELQRPETEAQRSHYTHSPHYESDDEMATTLRHEPRPVLPPPPRRHTLPLQPAPLRALPISYLTYATGAAHVSAGVGWWRAAGRAGGQVRFSPSQTAALERLFAHHKYLTPDERRALAHQLGLTDRQVKTWFQNRRAKWRRGGDGEKYQSTASSPSPQNDR